MVKSCTLVKARIVLVLSDQKRSDTSALGRLLSQFGHEVVERWIGANFKDATARLLSGSCPSHVLLLDFNRETGETFPWEELAAIKRRFTHVRVVVAGFKHDKDRCTKDVADAFYNKEQDDPRNFRLYEMIGGCRIRNRVDTSVFDPALR